MTLNKTVSKKIIEAIVHETFLNLGIFSSSSLLDSLKFLGFYYATNAGISINIEDLKTPDLKKDYIQNANDEIKKISQDWSEGIVSDHERFQSIIDSWNIATESLKNRIVDYYKNFDPTNNLYMMAFSGARGNMSQVRQLVGMRGLMADQDGKIIDLPIQTNFREGLSSIDYIISSYGARKGIVDTALKTADSGYLTRRLIYLSQDLIIREIDCKTKKGVLVFFKKESSFKNLIGRELLNIKEANFPYKIISDVLHLEKTEPKREIILNEKILYNLKAISPLLLTVRSSLTCQSKNSICQKCYGWDLAHQKLISLGETVGIIAAQSIGEPGTQLTMRTFHTGGIFTGESLKQVLSPFSGKIFIPDSLKASFYRTNHGVEVLKLEQETEIKIIDWKGKEVLLFLEIGSYLYISKTRFVYKNQLIAEVLNQSILSTQKKLKPIYTKISGKVISSDLIIPSYRKKQKGKIRRITLVQGNLSIASGKIFTLPIEADYLFSQSLKKEEPIARLKIITPSSGFIHLTNQINTNNLSLSIFNGTKKMNINCSDLLRPIRNCSLQIVPIVKNFQYVEKNSLLAYLYIYPNCNGKIISIEMQKTKFANVFFVCTESDTWNLYGPLGKSFSQLGGTEKKRERSYNELEIILSREQEIFKNFNRTSKSCLKAITPTTFKSPIIRIKQSGFLLKKDHYFHSFQYLDSICLPARTILNYTPNDFVFEKEIFAILVNYDQQTDDIVQGLPKIEELIEARKPKIKASLALQPGIFLESFLVGKKSIDKEVFKILTSLKKEKNSLKGFINISFSEEQWFDEKGDEKNILIEESEENEEKQIILIANSFLFKKNILVYNNKFFKVDYLSPGFKPIEENKEYIFKKEKIKFIKSKERKYNWKKEIIKHELLEVLYDFFHMKNTQKMQDDFERKKKDIFLKNYEESLPVEIFKSLEGEDYIFQLNENITLYLENIWLPLNKYVFPSTSKLLIKEGDFIDIGEAITDGITDSHELLEILFNYHSQLDGIIEGTLKSLNKFQLILVNSIQSIYQAQGVNIDSKHIEIVVRQMTSKVSIQTSGDTPFLKDELVPLSFIIEIYKAFEMNSAYKTPKFEPKLVSATNASLAKDGFLSSAGFQETRKILTKAAIEGNSDWLRGLKESLMSGRIIPAGSAFLNYKNYLDTLYYFKNERI
jgi:hypothetical protein